MHLLKLTEKELDARIDARIYQAFGERVAMPMLVPTSPASDPFMPYSTCCSDDFLHPRFYAIAKMLGVTPVWHRKLWEWVFIAHHLLDFVQDGYRGLGFGVGTESMPALLASVGASIVATDAPTDGGGWSHGSQWSASVDHLHAPHIIPDSLFDQRVSFQPCDMNAIPEDLQGFDFTWSSCAFEHLGTLQAGLDFVENSLKPLRSGGLAVHTTEYNMSSDTDTVAEGGTVLYRHCDLIGLIDRLRSQGHGVKPFVVGPFTSYLDNHVDVAPFQGSPHLKIRLAGYVTTSAGLVIRKA